MLLYIWFRLHGNVETMAVLSIGGGDASRKRDSIILTFADAKISVLEYDDSIHGLRTRWVHMFKLAYEQIMLLLY